MAKSNVHLLSKGAPKHEWRDFEVWKVEIEDLGILLIHDILVNQVLHVSLLNSYQQLFLQQRQKGRWMSKQKHERTNKRYQRRMYELTYLASRQLRADFEKRYQVKARDRRSSVRDQTCCTRGTNWILLLLSMPHVSLLALSTTAIVEQV